MINFGPVPANSVLPVYFTSYSSAGASITLTGLAITDVEIYKGIGITQRASDAGIVLIDTDGIDVDGVTGFHGFSIDLSDNTDAGFYVAGSFYTVLVSAVTVDAQTVNFIAATFRIMEAETTAGRPVVQTAALSANAITATSIAADAITDAKVASDVTIASVTGAVGSVTGAVGSVTGNVGGNVTGSVGSVATGGIASTSFAAGAITAAAIATGAVDADAIAADAVTEIQSGLATAASLATVSGFIDTEVASILAAVDTEIGTIVTAVGAIETDTQDIQTRLPAALVSGRIDASVGAMAANVMTAAAAAGDLTTELQSGLATAAAVAALNDISPAEVNAEVVDALATDTYAEPGQGTPAATASLSTKIGYLYKAWRNRKTQTSTTHSLYNDDALTVDQKSTVADDGTTASRSEQVTGP